jgi:hypothetical protein
LKILNLSVGDFSGVAYTLSHAMNKYHPEHSTINLRSHSSFSYPTIAEMRDYDIKLCKKIIMKADVILFHSAIKPLFQGLHFKPKDLEGKKKIIYFLGTELRQIGTQLFEQAREYLGAFQALIDIPDLFFYTKEKVKWLPSCRSFSEISHMYGRCNQDTKALEQFAVPRKKVIFCHAPSDEYKKGTATFNKVITDVMKLNPTVNYLPIRNQTWANCLQSLSMADVVFDSDPPFEYSYGMIAVEASIFKIPVVTKISNRVIEKIKEETGLKSPFITFNDEDDLFEKAYRLGREEDTRRMFGNMCYRYCKKLHDEKPVADKLMRIIEETD